MNQLITIALLFCLSYTMGLLRASAVLQLNNNLHVTLLINTQRAAHVTPSRTSLNYPAVRQIGGAIFKQETNGFLKPKTEAYQIL